MLAHKIVRPVDISLSGQLNDPHAGAAVNQFLGEGLARRLDAAVRRGVRVEHDHDVPIAPRHQIQIREGPVLVHPRPLRIRRLPGAPLPTPAAAQPDREQGPSGPGRRSGDRQGRFLRFDKQDGHGRVG